MKTEEPTERNWQPSPYFRDFIELDKIGCETGTDKCHTGHNFLDKYEFFLRPWKSRKFRLLELGVNKGGSLNMWSRYFSEAECIGVDISDECLKYAGENKKVIIADCGNEENLIKLASLAPDIVVDDASHLWSHQVKALVLLWPSLPPGGIYILEDAHTAYYSGYNDAVISGYEFLSAVANLVTNRHFANKEMWRSGKMVLDKEAEAVAASVELIAFMGGSCIMIKK